MKIPEYNPRDWRSHPPYSFKAYGSSVKRGPLKRLVPIKQTLSEIEEVKLMLRTIFSGLQESFKLH